jgi:hypothetical protein
MPVQVNFGPSLVELEQSRIPGDYNGDGTVDGGDYVIWRKTQGQTGVGLAADGNGDGIVDDADHMLWRAHFGENSMHANTGHPNGNAISIPEPPISALMLMALCLSNSTASPPNYA